MDKNKLKKLKINSLKFEIITTISFFKFKRFKLNRLKEGIFILFDKEYSNSGIYKDLINLNNSFELFNQNKNYYEIKVNNLSNLINKLYELKKNELNQIKKDYLNQIEKIELVKSNVDKLKLKKD